ncbi:hypothetical protein P5V15_007106 [Pogonomyrmex californicus]
MRGIAESVMEVDRRPVSIPSRAKDIVCRNCGKKSHSHKDCRGNLTCFYCKAWGYRKFDCLALRKRSRQLPVQPVSVPDRSSCYQPKFSQ